MEFLPKQLNIKPLHFNVETMEYDITADNFSLEISDEYYDSPSEMEIIRFRARKYYYVKQARKEKKEQEQQKKVKLREKKKADKKNEEFYIENRFKVRTDRYSELSKLAMQLIYRLNTTVKMGHYLAADTWQMDLSLLVGRYYNIGQSKNILTTDLINIIENMESTSAILFELTEYFLEKYRLWSYET